MSTVCTGDWQVVEKRVGRGATERADSLDSQLVFRKKFPAVQEAGLRRAVCLDLLDMETDLWEVWHFVKFPVSRKWVQVIDYAEFIGDQENCRELLAGAIV